MATFNGYILLDIIAVAGNNRPEWFDLIDYSNTSSVIDVQVPTIYGARTYVIPNTLPDNSYNGSIAPSYKDVFYNRILIEPIFINFGTIVSDQERTFVVFNGYLSNRILENITLNDFDSYTDFIGDTPPETYLPLEERTHTIRISSDGPPNIDASIYYDWEGTSDDITVSFIGSRIILLPITFRSNLKEKLIWSTDVLTARDGTEQRIRNRDAPRQQLTFQAYLNNDDRVMIENIVYGRRALTFAIPLWIENRFGDSITAGSLTINVDTRFGDFRVGELALIWESSRKYYAFQIQELTDSTIISINEIPISFDNPIIMPLRTARFLSDPVRSSTGYDAIISASVEIIDNTKLDTTQSVIQFNNEDFYDEEPLMVNTNGVNDTYNTKVDLIDFNTGSIKQVGPWEYNRVTRKFNLVLEGLENIWNFRLWLHRRAGRLIPFYMPTFENNLKILDRGILVDRLICQNNIYTSESSDRTRLAFKKTDGSWVFKTITSSSVDEFNQEIINLDSSLNFDYEEIDFVSYMGLKRLASDSFELNWLSNNVAIVSVSITEISS